MQEKFSHHIQTFEQERKYKFLKDSSISFFSLHFSNIKKGNEIQEVMRLGCFTGDIFSIKGEVKSPIEVIIDTENITIQEGFLLKIHLPAAEIQCLTLNKKEINEMIEKKEIEEIIS